MFKHLSNFYSLIKEIPGIHLIRDVKITTVNYQNVPTFCNEHRLWEGLLKYKWLGRILILAAVILSVQFLRSCLNWWEESTTAENVSLSAVGGLIGNIFKDGYDLFVIGGLKYIVLVLVEVIIFHFTRRTLEIVTNDSVDSSFSAFVEAQKRMVGVVIYSFIMESVFSVLAGIGLNILGIGLIKPGIVFLIQCFFLGFAIIDNYNEIFHMTIKQSFKYCLQYAGVALAIGVPVYVIMLFPLLGTIAGPVIGAIAATITMNQLFVRDQNMAWVFVEKPK